MCFADDIPTHHRRPHLGRHCHSHACTDTKSLQVVVACVCVYVRATTLFWIESQNVVLPISGVSSIQILIFRHGSVHCVQAFATASRAASWCMRAPDEIYRQQIFTGNRSESKMPDELLLLALMCPIRITQTDTVWNGLLKSHWWRRVYARISHRRFRSVRQLVAPSARFVRTALRIAWTSSIIIVLRQRIIWVRSETPSWQHNICTSSVGGGRWTRCTHERTDLCRSP